MSTTPGTWTRPIYALMAGLNHGPTQARRLAANDALRRFLSARLA